ncbi:tRNA (cytidine(56)-2'-O)-methyltransferase [uncultured archaeon]|nr:tRNA (cytidine(56)-2'-O)-methyltransferase [uncultured archaeon]
MEVTVLRLGHRVGRDKRLSTHVCLTARAFGAGKVIMDARDPRVEESVKEVVAAWGGGFTVEYAESWKSVIKNFVGVKVHLTMYGLPLDDVAAEIRDAKKPVLAIVGGPKVPSEVYHMVDYNVAVGSQPHSEVAALSLLLDRLNQGEELGLDFKGSLTIIPQACGKKVAGTYRSKSK